MEGICFKLNVLKLAYKNEKEQKKHKELTSTFKDFL